MPIDSNGFRRPTIDEIEADFKTRFVNKFTVDGQEPSTEPESFLGILSSTLAKMKDDLYKDVENTYYSLFISTASGVSLERALTPIARKPATKSSGTQWFIGDEGRVIPAGFVVETEDEREYVTTESGTIDVTGILDLTVESVLAGIDQNAPIGAVRFIPVPLPGLDSTNNVSQIRGGTNIETENNYRTRGIEQKTAGKSTSSVQSIIARVRTVTGVQDATGDENTGETIDSDGRPPGSVEIVVEGGDDSDIAAAIYDSIGGGVESFGDITVTIIDQVGDTQPVSFSRVTEKEIFVKVILSTNSAYDPAIAEPLIKQRILEYIGGVDLSSETFAGLRLNEDVVAWKTKSVLFETDEAVSIDGVDDISLLLGLTAGGETEKRIDISARERAYTDFANITVEV